MESNTVRRGGFIYRMRERSGIIAAHRANRIEMAVPFVTSCRRVPSSWRVSKSTSCVPKPVPWGLAFGVLPMPLSAIFSSSIPFSTSAKLRLILPNCPVGKAYLSALVSNSFTISPTEIALSTSKSSGCIGNSTLTRLAVRIVSSSVLANCNACFKKIKDFILAKVSQFCQDFQQINTSSHRVPFLRL